MIQISRPSKPERNKIDLSDSATAHHWAKKLGKSKEEIAAAVEKVGDNCDTVRKELGCPEES
jgi:phage host-nuclease inhibitor protein Gam